MKKKLLSLALALAMCLALLPSTAMAAGTQKVFIDEEHGVKITLNEFLRVEINRCKGNAPVEIYVVSDNSDVTVEVLEGKKYVPNYLSKFRGAPTNIDPSEAPEGYAAYVDYVKNPEDYAYQNNVSYVWSSEYKEFYIDNMPESPVEAALETYTVSPADSDDYYYDDTIYLNGNFGITWICESDFAKLVPATLQASTWAQAEVGSAYDAQIMPFSPYAVDCTQGMTRADFAETTVLLYAAMIGEYVGNLDVDSENPFTDLFYAESYDPYMVGRAYNLGFVNGTGGTNFDPDGTLTRQEAAVMLSRVYAKAHGDIPNVTGTTFADDKDVADWAKSAVAFMSDKGIVNGVGDNRFAPTSTLSIQESVVMAYRMLERLK